MRVQRNREHYNLIREMLLSYFAQYIASGLLATPNKVHLRALCSRLVAVRAAGLAGIQEIVTRKGEVNECRGWSAAQGGGLR